MRTGENPSQITSDHPDGARPTPRADSSEPLGRTSRPSPPDPAAPGAPAAPAAPEVAATAAWASVHGVASLASRGVLELVGTDAEELLDQLLPQS